MLGRICIFCGGLFGAGALAMAAVAAHGLAGLPPPSLAAVRSAIDMQGWHALALIAIGGWLPRGGIPARLAACGFAVGMLLFCGAVYGHEIFELPVAPLAPIGATTLILSWLLLTASAFRR